MVGGFLSGKVDCVVLADRFWCAIAAAPLLDVSFLAGQEGLHAA